MTSIVPQHASRLFRNKPYTMITWGNKLLIQPKKPILTKTDEENRKTWDKNYVIIATYYLLALHMVCLTTTDWEGK